MAAARGKGRGLPVRKPTTSFYDVLVVDVDEVEAAAEQLKQATDPRTTMLRFSKDPEVAASVVTAENEARARLKACYERIWFKELPPAKLEAIRSAHPLPDDADKMPPEWQWPFVHHLAAASATQITRTPEEWAEWLADWSAPNFLEFRQALFSAQSRTATEGLPKG